MNNLLPWLPDMICVDGDFTALVNQLYNIFHHDFIQSHPNLSGMEVWYDKKIKPGDTYEEIFWHLIQRDHENQGTRAFDPRRAERLPWCAPLLNNSNQPEVKYWVSREKKKLTCYVWLEEFDYVVILQKRTLPSKVIDEVEKPSRTVAYLKTAYHVDGESRRRYFRRKYEDKVS